MIAVDAHITFRHRIHWTHRRALADAKGANVIAVSFKRMERGRREGKVGLETAN